MYAGKEIFQLFDVLLGRGIVLPLGCQFHDAADFRNSIEPVSAAIAFHTVTQQLDGSKILVGQRAVKCVDVLLAIGQKAGHDAFKIALDPHNDSIG